MTSIKKAQEARRQALADGTALTKTIKSEALHLLRSGASADEVKLLLSLTDTQLQRCESALLAEQQSDRVADSVQWRKNKVSDNATQLADQAMPIMRKLLRRIDAVAEVETDLSKLSSAVKTLHALTQGAEEREEITAVVSRLRGKL